MIQKDWQQYEGYHVSDAVIPTVRQHIQIVLSMARAEASKLMTGTRCHCVIHAIVHLTVLNWAPGPRVKQCLIGGW